MTGQVCRVCGCTDNWACVDDLGWPCEWVDDELCSACVDDDADLPVLYEDHPLPPVEVAT